MSYDRQKGRGAPGIVSRVLPSEVLLDCQPESIVACRLLLSQPFHVAEQFTGFEGKYVPVSETIRGFREILDGKHDDLPESAFLFAGTIDEVVEKAKKGA